MLDPPRQVVVLLHHLLDALDLRVGRPRHAVQPRDERRERVDERPAPVGDYGIGERLRN